MSDRYDLILIDGHSLVYRAFFALPPLSMPGGQQTNAVYGLLRMLFRLINERRPGGMIVALDAGLPTARLEVYPEYKAHRPEMPSELRSQFPLVREALSALNVPIVEAQGYEADDVIGTLARQADEQGLRCLIVTGDRDVLQLVSGRVHACVTKKGITETVLYDPETIREQYGIEPQQLIDVKALMGDQSDNIPGVAGIGEKTALKLIQRFGSVESAIEHTRDAGSRAERLLAENTEQALMSRRLAEIDRHAPVTLDVSRYRSIAPDPDRTAEVLTRFGFRSLIAQVPGLKEEPADVQGDLFSQVSTREAFPVSRIVERDIERLRLEIEREGTVAVMFEPAVEGVGAVLGIATTGSAWWWNDDIDQVPSLLSRLIPSWMAGTGQPRLIGHGIKPLAGLIRRRGGQPGPIAFDSELAWHLIDPARSSYPADDLAVVYLGEALSPLVTKKTRTVSPDAVGVGVALAQRSDALLRLEEPLRGELRDRGLDELFTEVELPLIGVLAAMEARGVAVDRARLDQLGAEFSRRLSELESDIYRVAGDEFNINSTRQVAELLFERLGLPSGRKTKTGYSTGAEVLEALAADHEVVRLILEHRQLSKLKSTYVDALCGQIDPGSGRVHTRFNQTVTTTGRLSSSDPNLQNIPIRMDIGRRIRGVFVPGDDGLVLLSADYSQIELRVLAHLSGDEALLSSFRAEEDIHTRTASEVFGVDLSQVTPDMRSRAKAVNFGIVYGITDFGLARDLGVSQAEAKAYIDGYFRRYPAVRRYLDEQVAAARALGYVTTVLNRRRYLPDINSRNLAARKFAERTAFNTPVQGSAADIIKLAMLTVERRLREEDRPARLLLQVHDELVLEVERSSVRQVARILIHEMEGAYPLLVPLRVDAKTGEDWSRMVGVEV